MTRRRPTPADLSEILELINDPASPHRQEACRHREAPESGHQLYDRLDQDENLVIEDDGKIVAYASWQIFAHHAHLNVLSVAGASQRQGLGSQLLDAFRARLKADGVTSYSLRAYADSPWAIAFYARQGLKPWTPMQQEAPMHEGLKLYLALAVSHGQWPEEGKVLFFEPLGG